LPVRGTGLIRVTESGGRLVVTTERLFLSRLPEREFPQSHEWPSAGTVVEKSKAMSYALLSYTIPNILVLEHPLVAISVEIPLVTIVDTFKQIYGRKAWYVPR
jgi:hypothetical protein